MPSPRDLRRTVCQTPAAGHGRPPAGRAAGRVHANADDLFRLNRAVFSPRRVPVDGDFRALDVIRGMLPGEIGIAAQDDALGSVFVIPDRRAGFMAIGGVNDQGADGVGSVIQTDGVFGAHGNILMFRCFFAMPSSPLCLTG